MGGPSAFRLPRLLTFLWLRYPYPISPPEFYARTFGKKVEELTFIGEQQCLFSSSDPKPLGKEDVAVLGSLLGDLVLDFAIATEPETELTIFDLLNCVVLGPTPTLPKGIWNDEFTDFIDIWYVSYQSLGRPLSNDFCHLVA